MYFHRKVSFKKFVSMAKKKTTHKLQLLSPENYIRQRSRNLPIHGCWVNNDWSDGQLATIVVAREHVSGNITYAVYLVDLFCLGVKNSFFRYNELRSDFDDYLKSSDEHFGIEATSYNQVHNIIYAAIEYAEGYGFKPQKEFTQTTKYMLEEDTDDIPLMEIICGDKDGKPLYFRSEFDSPEYVRQVLAQLEKTAGKGNYNYILNVDEEESEEYFDDDEHHYHYQSEDIAAIKRDLMGLDDDELKKYFLDIITKKDTLDEMESEDDLKRLFVVSNIIIGKIIDYDVLDNCYGDLEDSLLVDTIVVNGYLPNSLFQGVKDIDGENVFEMFIAAIDSIVNNDKPKKVLKEMRDIFGDVPANDYLDFRLQLVKHEGDVGKCGKELAKYRQKHPGYFLLELYWNEYLCLEKGDENTLERMKALLHQTPLPLTEFEYAEFVFVYAAHYIHIAKEEVILEQIIAMEDFVHDHLSSDLAATAGLLYAASMMKIAQLSLYLRNT